MTGRLVALAVALLTPAVAFAQHFHHHVGAAPEDEQRVWVCKKPYAEPTADDGIRKVDWPVYVAGKDPENARRFFEQGMTLFYGFDYEGAMRNFRHAMTFADRDTFPMAHWGVAMAAAPNINLGQDEECGKVAFAESREAQRQAGLAGTKIPLPEAALIDALVARYGEEPKDRVQAVDYAVAMEGVWLKYHKDPNAANLGAVYAESLLNLRPWALYDGAGRPAIDTQRVIAVLKEAIDDAPRGNDKRAIGANHYWIHTAEAGPKPDEAAMASADRLFDGVPSSGHLLHMPSHIYFLAGQYDKAVEANTNAINADSKQFEKACEGGYRTYSEKPECRQLYYGHYGAHDYFFRAIAQAFQGHYDEALEDADRTAAHARHFINNEPGLQRYMTAPLLVAAAVGRWDKVRSIEEPPRDCYIELPFKEKSGCHIVRAMWHWAQGMALAKPSTLADARRQVVGFLAERADIQSAGPTGWGNNRADAVLAVAEEMLRARIAWAEGKRPAALEHLKLAVTHEDAMVYDEPPQFIFPTRQALGGAYLAVGAFKEARDVFEADLQRHQGNGRSLYGMWKALERLPGQQALAEQYRLKYKAAWVDKGGEELTNGMLWPVGMQ